MSCQQSAGGMYNGGTDPEDPDDSSSEEGDYVDEDAKSNEEAAPPETDGQRINRLYNEARDEYNRIDKIRPYDKEAADTARDIYHTASNVLVAYLRANDLLTESKPKPRDWSAESAARERVQKREREEVAYRSAERISNENQKELNRDMGWRQPPNYRGGVRERYDYDVTPKPIKTCMSLGGIRKHTNRINRSNHKKHNKSVVYSRRRKHTSSLMRKRHKRSINRTRYGGSISKKKYKPTHTRKRRYNKSRTYKY